MTETNEQTVDKVYFEKNNKECARRLMAKSHHNINVNKFRTGLKLFSQSQDQYEINFYSNYERISNVSAKEVAIFRTQ
jgi:hypothetical protein